MNRGKTTVRGGLAVLTGLVVLAALCCGTAWAQPVTGEQDQNSISVSGSTTVLPIAQRAAEEFQNMNPDVEVLVSGGGSSVGVQAVGEGTADIGMVSRELKPEEEQQYPDLVETTIASDGIAVIVNPANTVENLTLSEARGIYNGTYTNWNEVGGSDEQIVVVGRDSASGTREFFSEAVMEGEDFVNTQLEVNSNGAMQQTVAQTPGAIGYVGLGYVDETVKALNLTVNGTSLAPNQETVTSGEYPLARDLYMFTRGEPSGLAAEYINFILSDTGQQVVLDEGFVPLNQTGTDAGGQQMTEPAGMAM
ncbi:phosphate ABC transporter substrate-binding protein [Methanoculleus sp.]|uniref:phosphate ABC transporter substrate-binding protein n=1 Tax=Methanoculleus sp. TaxID=90427 RepID=UPI001BD62233|nr:phosphate ABC transporter substrate-binding protein [Methanoculleus sp.]